MFLRLILLNKCKIKKQLRSASGNFHQSVAEDSPSGPASLSFREEDPADSSACGRGAGVSNSSVSSVARTLAFADSLIALADALSEARNTGNQSACSIMTYRSLLVLFPCESTWMSGE